MVAKIKSELSQIDEGLAPKRKRFLEQKESLATLKLLYPSKYRKDQFRKRGEGVRLPGIKTNKGMLMEMIGLKEKRLPRAVSEAALKLISALETVDNNY